ncbi:MAG: hypothetical protein Q9224_005642, partial [Gallowayella concinna]
MNENMVIDLTTETESECSDTPNVSSSEETARRAWIARQAKLDADILRLADPDATDDENSTEVVMSDSEDNAADGVSPQARTGFQEEYAELMRTGYNLRRRIAAEESPYLASWQHEKERKRRERLEAASRIEKEEMEVSSVSMGGTTLIASPQISQTPLTRVLPESTTQTASTWENGQNEEAFTRLLRAAILREQNDIPCTSPNCPVTHPHGEGLYLYEGEVPNSGWAKVYFAPSIPPPAVVEAFNKIDGLPSWDDLNIKDRFFQYHTVPCRPSKHLNKVGKRPCTSQHCGVEEPHQTGLYLHD